MNKAFAIILLTVLSPLLVLISIFIILVDGFPIFFTQQKYGRNNKIFRLYKFRTMKNNSPLLPTEKFEDAESYIIFGGKFMRKYSLDELPQFLNIILGDMNFIGPRPAMTTKNEQIVQDMRSKRNIHTIQPGITGWAQVNGRDNNSFEEKVKLDYYYMTNKNLILDLKIILLTFFVIFTKRGVKH